MLMPRAPRLRRRADDDGAWKRLLGELLQECVAFALPELHEAIDWGRTPVSLEQELRPRLRQATLGRRVADLVVQVWLRDGGSTWLLIHAEVQGDSETDFAERMYLYAALLHMHYRTRPTRRAAQSESPPELPQGIVGIALLTDADPTWQPGPYRWGWGEYGLDYRYRALKLTDWRSRWDELANDARPFAWVVRTWLAVQAAGTSLTAQGDARREMGRALLVARRAGQLTTDQAAAIYAFLDAVNRLPEALAEVIDREVELIEEEPVAELLTRWERRGWRQGHEEGREEGHEEGIVEGMSTTIISLLNGKQIAMDAATEERIRGLGRDKLHALIAVIFTIQTRADLDAWLAQAEAQK
ncbi:MAG: hypothetical protein U0841_02755 [Chloroflexia bacterium]